MKTEINIFACIRCRLPLDPAMPWRCGSCDHANYRTETYSLLNKCQRCSKKPKAYVCTECEKINFLDGDHAISEPARRIAQSPRARRIEDPELQRRRGHTAEMNDLEREIEKNKKLVELAKIKGSITPNNEKTEAEKAVEQLVARAKKVLVLEGAMPGARRILMEEFKSSPEALEKVDEVLMRLVTEHNASL